MGFFTFMPKHCYDFKDDSDLFIIIQASSKCHAELLLEKTQNKSPEDYKILEDGVSTSIPRINGKTIIDFIKMLKRPYASQHEKVTLWIYYKKYEEKIEIECNTEKSTDPLLSCTFPEDGPIAYDYIKNSSYFKEEEEKKKEEE